MTQLCFSVIHKGLTIDIPNTLNGIIGSYVPNYEEYTVVNISSFQAFPLHGVGEYSRNHEYRIVIVAEVI